MRIISGTYKSKRIVAPKNLPARPTTDFAKEGLFNVLMHQIDFHGLSILDLFSGTGNISYEFISRGVSRVTCVDQHFKSLKFIKHTAQEQLNFDGLSVVCQDALKYTSKPLDFDLVFADPPYDFASYDQLIDNVCTHLLKSASNLFILEHSSKRSFEQFDFFQNQKQYGNVAFSFFKKVTSS